MSFVLAWFNAIRFLLWGYLKNKVFQRVPHSIDKWKNQSRLRLDRFLYKSWRILWILSSAKGRAETQTSLFVIWCVTRARLIRLWTYSRTNPDKYYGFVLLQSDVRKPRCPSSWFDARMISLWIVGAISLIFRWHGGGWVLFVPSLRDVKGGATGRAQ